ncbi:DUF2695 domain-containing protein [Rubinisphaera brasiliensis]|uniref:Uncharacterized protein n=1 Tax=Rubinisphaera brasiliensis (strain ATCC 49424 / DSM 5305 / JCM 21570 / IAM 15109 / NBRC 103401 / IFAM 1448) TaxID=756272 RepID=F0SGS3_RUBBR|nr:DUF2695 domain-containing protein [Rubinisphaera brasiliensis]ADY58358.1 hypothetical protein Plabr_0731 [Rubinisphaera brasiliensis DSM 5305]
MDVVLNANQVTGLVRRVDDEVRASGCDHTHRFTAEWARERSIAWDDLLDALEQNGAFCDCEVALNLEEDRPLSVETHALAVEGSNRWLLPPSFTPSVTVVSKILIAKEGIGKNNHAHDAEWLVPAPFDVKPRKRIRKSVHFFVGVESGLPTEIGFVTSIKPIAIGRFAQTIRSSKASELQMFDNNVAAFLCQKIAKLADGTPVGVDILERVVVASKHQELNVHRVFLRR